MQVSSDADDEEEEEWVLVEKKDCQRLPLATNCREEERRSRRGITSTRLRSSATDSGGLCVSSPPADVRMWRSETGVGGAASATNYSHVEYVSSSNEFLGKSGAPSLPLIDRRCSEPKNTHPYQRSKSFPHYGGDELQNYAASSTDTPGRTLRDITQVPCTNSRANVESREPDEAAEDEQPNDDHQQLDDGTEESSDDDRSEEQQQLRQPQNNESIYLVSGFNTKNLHVGPQINLYGSGTLHEVSSLTESTKNIILAKMKATQRRRYGSRRMCDLKLPCGKKTLHVRRSLELEVAEMGDDCVLKPGLPSGACMLQMGVWDAGARTLIQGTSGSGRTTFCHQRAYDWVDNPDSPLARFELFFLVSGKTVETSLQEALVSQVRGCGNFDTDAVSDVVVKHMLWEKHDDMVIVIDGYEDLTQREEVDKLIRGELYPGATVLVMALPSVCLHDVFRDFDGRVVLQGFLSSQIEDYTRMVFGADTLRRVAHILQDQLGVIGTFFTCPIFLHTVCTVIENRPELQLTLNVTNLFREVIMEMLKRGHATRQLPRNLRDIGFLLKFGKLCLESLYLKDRATFILCESRRAQNCDVFDDVRMLLNEDRESYRPIHHRVIEFVAALYLVTVADKKEFRRLLCNVLLPKQQRCATKSLMP